MRVAKDASNRYITNDAFAAIHATHTDETCWTVDQIILQSRPFRYTLTRHVGPLIKWYCYLGHLATHRWDMLDCWSNDSAISAISPDSPRARRRSSSRIGPEASRPQPKIKSGTPTMEDNGGGLWRVDGEHRRVLACVLPGSAVIIILRYPSLLLSLLLLLLLYNSSPAARRDNFETKVVISECEQINNHKYAMWYTQQHTYTTCSHLLL